MTKVTVNEDRCKGCELCVAACPKGIMKLDKVKLNTKGYHPAHCSDQGLCIGCAFCALTCPDCAITVEK